MKCPKCGSYNCQIITEYNTKGKDYYIGRGLCGAVLAGPIGALCGFCGSGKKINTETYWICNNCGRKWKT